LLALGEAAPALSRGPVKTIRYLVCGERSFGLRVVRHKSFGSRTQQVSKP
jgi:hypothetical protein